MLVCGGDEEWGCAKGEVVFVGGGELEEGLGGSLEREKLIVEIYVEGKRYRNLWGTRGRRDFRVRGSGGSFASHFSR